jgi:hypothetical protein
MDARRAVVSLAPFGDKGVVMDKDFVVLVEQAEPFRTRAVLELDETNNSTAIQLTFCPELMANADAETMELKNEFIFIVDRYARFFCSGRSSTDARFCCKCVRCVR